MTIFPRHSYIVYLSPFVTRLYRSLDAFPLTTGGATAAPAFLEAVREYVATRAYTQEKTSRGRTVKRYQRKFVLCCFILFDASLLPPRLTTHGADAF